MNRRHIRHTVIPLVVIAAAVQIGSPAIAQTWTRATATAGWSVRFSHAALVHDGRLWVLGGGTTGGVGLNDVWYTTNGANWFIATGGAPWPGRWSHAAAAVAGKMWIYGGWAGARKNDVWSSADGAAWTLAATGAGWGMRDTLQGFAFDGRMWTALGYDGSSSKNDVWYSTNGTTWSVAANPAPWAFRDRGMAVVHDGRMWVVGGLTTQSSTRYNDVWHSTNGAAWARATSAAPWSARLNHSATGHDGRIWLMGGQPPFIGGTNDVWSSADGASWSASANAPWSIRAAFPTVSYLGKLWMMGGTDGAGNHSRDVWSMASPCTAPSISVHPASQTQCEGQAATFSVTASGTAPLTYQWRLGGSPISGATASSYTIDPITLGHAGNYTVVVTNSCGNVTSNVAMLTVDAKPDCTISLGGQVCPGTSGNNASVPDAGGSSTYVWSVTGGAIGGGQGTRMLTFSAGTGSSVILDVTVTNGNGCSRACQTIVNLSDGTWTGPDGGSFMQASNWSPAAVPTAGAILTNAGASDNRAILSSPSMPLICSLSISASGSGRQILQIGSGSRLTASAGSTVGSGGEINMQGGEWAGGLVTNSSNTIQGFGLISASVNNLGLLEGNPGASNLLRLTGASLANAAGATLRARIGAAVSCETSVNTQQGTIEALAGAAVTCAQPLTNLDGATISLLGGSLTSAQLTNDAGGDIHGFGELTGNLTNDGEFVAIADLDIMGDVTNDGTMTVQNGTLTITGNYSGSGTIIGGFGP